MELVALRLGNGVEVYVNPEHVASVSTEAYRAYVEDFVGVRTLVTMGDGREYWVQSDIEHVLRALQTTPIRTHYWAEPS